MDPIVLTAIIVPVFILGFILGRLERKTQMVNAHALGIQAGVSQGFMTAIERPDLVEAAKQQMESAGAAFKEETGYKVGF